MRIQGLGRHREAAAVFEAGLAVDPFHFDLRAGLQAAQQGVLADLLSGQCPHLLSLCSARSTAAPLPQISYCPLFSVVL